MDDPSVNPVPPPPPAGPFGPVADLNVAPAQPQPPPPGGPKLKEQGPVTPEKKAGIDVAESDKVAKEEGDEYWENYAKEIELEKEIAEIGGVEKVEAGEVNVPEPIAKEMGIKPIVNAETPIEKVADFSVRKVALSDDQLTAGAAKPVTSAFRWLVEWFIFQLKKAHYVVSNIKGKIMRQKPSL